MKRASFVDVSQNVILETISATMRGNHIVRRFSCIRGIGGKKSATVFETFVVGRYMLYEEVHGL